jgi:hypothetical protein
MVSYQLFHQIYCAENVNLKHNNAIEGHNKYLNVLSNFSLPIFKAFNVVFNFVIFFMPKLILMIQLWDSYWQWTGNCGFLSGYWNVGLNFLGSSGSFDSLKFQEFEESGFLMQCGDCFRK